VEKISPDATNAPRRRSFPAVAERNASGNNRSRSRAAQNVDALSLLNEFERLLDLARTESYYQLLGLQPDSPRSEVKRRFASSRGNSTRIATWTILIARRASKR
jgi:hypothetical protein